MRVSVPGNRQYHILLSLHHSARLAAVAQNLRAMAVVPVVKDLGEDVKRPAIGHGVKEITGNHGTTIADRCRAQMGVSLLSNV